jgi:hypothetical protein
VALVVFRLRVTESCSSKPSMRGLLSASEVTILKFSKERRNTDTRISKGTRILEFTGCCRVSCQRDLYTFLQLVCSIFDI